MTPDDILKDAKQRMDKAVEHLQAELRGVRTGRASPALIEYVKVDYYGSPTDLKALAAISAPEPTQLLVSPFDATAVSEIKKAIEAADLGLNPQVEGKQIRIRIPDLTTERRQQLAAHVKKLGEEAKVAVRNVRRDANKHLEAIKKDKDAHISEDAIEDLKKDVQDLLKKHEERIDELVAEKNREIMEL